MNAASLNKFLQPTATIDSTHPSIVAKATEIAGNSTDDLDVARRCLSGFAMRCGTVRITKFPW
jgi:hypothetical protein